MRVIVTDVGSRKTFDVVNILQRVYRLPLLLFAEKDYRVQLPLIYGQRVYPLSNASAEAFERDLLPVLEQHRDEPLVYMPVSEKATLFFYDLLSRHSLPNVRFLLPDKEAFQLTSDKARFQQYCEKYGFPVPRSYHKDNLQELADDFQPVIAKLKSGAGSVGMKYIDQVEQLPVLEQLDFDAYLVQERVISTDKVAGAFFLCREGKTVAYYGHRRLRTFPPEGGVTVFSKAEENPEARRIGEALLDHLGWNGFAMIEFIQDQRSKDWKIIELNPRLWGSVLLSEFTGAAFLKKYVDLCLQEPVAEQPVDHSKFIRWIFPFDLLNLLKGKISWKTFSTLSLADTCYINFTYSNWRRALLFLTYFTVNFRSIRRYLKKVFG
jgi:hypothetical protein